MSDYKEPKDELLDEKPVSEMDDKSVKKKKKEKRKNLIASFKGLCDLVINNNEVKFLTQNSKIITKKKIKDEYYFPPQQSDLDYIVPKMENVLEEAKKHSDASDESDAVQGYTQGCERCYEIYGDLIKYHKQFSELPHNKYYDLLALWDFHTYFIEKFDFSPIIYFFADKERGKTRTTKGMIYVARRGVMTETLREPNIIRWGRDHKATLLFDVKNFPKKINKAGSEDLIYGRAERGVTASRVLYPEKGPFKDMVKFQVFGPTLVTSNRMMDDIGISRTVMIEMKPSTKIFKEEPTKNQGLKFRELLTGVRLAHMKDDFVKVEKEETGRLEDMMIGYLSMIKTLFPKKEKTYYDLKKIIKAQKKDISGDSMEAQVLQVIIELERMVEEGSLCLTYESICSVFNEGRKENLHLSPITLGKITRGMGFDTKRNSAGTKRGILYDEKLINTLKVIYGIEDRESEGVSPQTPSEASDSSGSVKDNEPDIVKEAEKLFNE